MAVIQNDKIDYNNILLEAVDTLMTNKLSKLPYDTTKIGVIVDNQNASYGQYTVLIDKASQIVYSENKTYQIGDKVYIMSPNTNIADSTKIILSKYVDEDTLKSYSTLDEHNINVYTIPYTSSSVELQANNEAYSQINFPICNISNLTLPINLFTNLAITADFKCDLGLSYQMRSGIYGLKIIITTTKPQSYEFIFDSSEFFGNPYFFIVPQTQTKIMDISAINDIASIQLIAFQDNNFSYNSNLSATPLDVPVCSVFNDNIILPELNNNISHGIDLNIIDNKTKNQEAVYNIAISNVQLQLGFYISSETDQLHLYNNARIVYPLWIHKINNQYKGYSDGVFSVESINTSNSPIHAWAGWQLMNSEDGAYNYNELEYERQKQIFTLCNNSAIRERALHECGLLDYKELLYPFAQATEINKQLQNTFSYIRRMAQLWVKLGNCLRFTFNENYNPDFEPIPTRDGNLLTKPKIGHARSSRNHEEPGDQDGHEVEITDWKRTSANLNEPYRIFRAHDSEIQARLARLMTEACVNDHIGYSRTHRASAYSWLNNHLINGQFRTALDASSNGIEEDVCVDCSSLVWLCCFLAGINISSSIFTTASEPAALLATGEFDEIAEYNAEHPNEPWYNLQAGDILVVRKNGQGHTAIVTKSFNGQDAELTEPIPGVDEPEDEPYNAALIEGYEIAETLNEDELETLIIIDQPTNYGLDLVLSTKDNKILQNWLKIIYNLGINGYPAITTIDSAGHGISTSELLGWNVHNEEWQATIEAIDFPKFIAKASMDILNGDSDALTLYTEFYNTIENPLLFPWNYSCCLQAFYQSLMRFNLLISKIINDVQINEYVNDQGETIIEEIPIINKDSTYNAFISIYDDLNDLKEEYYKYFDTIQKNALACIMRRPEEQVIYMPELTVQIDYTLQDLQNDNINDFKLFTSEFSDFEELYKNKYCLYWYKYLYEFIPDKDIDKLYFKRDWELLPRFTNQGINFDNDELYTENQLVEINEVTAQSVRAVLIFNHVPYQSNIINFNNNTMTSRDIVEQLPVYNYDAHEIGYINILSE